MSKFSGKSSSRCRRATQRHPHSLLPHATAHGCAPSAGGGAGSRDNWHCAPARAFRRGRGSSMRQDRGGRASLRHAWPVPQQRPSDVAASSADSTARRRAPAPSPTARRRRHALRWRRPTTTAPSSRRPVSFLARRGASACLPPSSRRFRPRDARALVGEVAWCRRRCGLATSCGPTAPGCAALEDAALSRSSWGSKGESAFFQPEWHLLRPELAVVEESPLGRQALGDATTFSKPPTAKNLKQGIPAKMRGPAAAPAGHAGPGRRS